LVSLLLTGLSLPQRIDTIHELELQHQQAIHGSDMIAKDDQSRRLKLRVLMLRDEKTLLSDQLVNSDSQIKSLSNERDKLRGELGSSQHETRSHFRSQAREIASLKVSPRHVHPSVGPPVHRPDFLDRLSFNR
jgi:predicted RNase H-like nuclease (RuvC/YqgF family)